MLQCIRMQLIIITMIDEYAPLALAAISKIPNVPTQGLLDTEILINTSDFIQPNLGLNMYII